MRLVRATARIAAEHGEESVTVARVVELANVSKETFYEHFQDRRDCLSAALDDFVSLAANRVRAAGSSRPAWVERMRAGLRALLDVLDENPELARVCVADAVSGGLVRRERGGKLFEELVPAIDRGRDACLAGRQPPDGAARSVIGGTLGMIHARLLGRDQPPLVDLLNPLMGMMVLPYLGEAAAIRELSPPSPAVSRAGGERHRAWRAGVGGTSRTRAHGRPRP
jgi:AcrR family transcriptional regulator